MKKSMMVVTYVITKTWPVIIRSHTYVIMDAVQAVVAHCRKLNSSLRIFKSGSYDLVVILLLIFVFAILFTALAMFVIYYIYNRKNDERGYEFSGSFTEDSVVGSQVNGLPSYFGERRYLPHVSLAKLF
ncbi:hypothetical protein X798_08040 [Onchocerca flexuosa]|uniref:Uncharacterized protein n=1 Tax=Onchocerca flexuosa TaxID=387005 RepID=A0A238BJ32_9BILA|nr:hypothetical protein X798_08040 [Onchocerca flexuosa]